MARKARVEFAGALYHVLDRGDRREVIFRDEADRARFLETLGEACGRTGWRVHAYVLMSNHCHLMIETPQANLVAGMRWLLDGAGEKLRVRRAVDAPVRRSHGEDEARRLLRRGLAWLGLERFRKFCSRNVGRFCETPHRRRLTQTAYNAATHFLKSP